LKHLLAAIGIATVAFFAGVIYTTNHLPPTTPTPTMKSLLLADPKASNKLCKHWFFAIPFKERKQQ